jgi:hypothetical protein
MFVIRTLSSSDLGYEIVAATIPGSISADQLDAQKKAHALQFAQHPPRCPANVNVLISADNTGKGKYFEKTWRLVTEAGKSCVATNVGGFYLHQVDVDFAQGDMRSIPVRANRRSWNTLPTEWWKIDDAEMEPGRATPREFKRAEALGHLVDVGLRMSDEPALSFDANEAGSVADSETLAVETKHCPACGMAYTSKRKVVCSRCKHNFKLDYVGVPEEVKQTLFRAPVEHINMRHESRVFVGGERQVPCQAPPAPDENGLPTRTVEREMFPPLPYNPAVLGNMKDLLRT